MPLPIYDFVSDYVDRSKFGSEILIIHLVMPKKDAKQRLTVRHFGDKNITNILMVKFNTTDPLDPKEHIFIHLQYINDLCTVDENLDNAVVVNITNTMEKEEIMELVLAEADKYFADKS